MRASRIALSTIHAIEDSISRSLVIGGKTAKRAKKLFALLARFAVFVVLYH